MDFSKKPVSVTVFILIFSLFISVLPFSPVNAAQDFWTGKRSTPHYGFSEFITAGVVNGKIFAFSNAYNYEYDPITDSWTENTPMPTPRTFFGLVVHENKIYILDKTGVLEVYNAETDTWETKTSMQPITSTIKHVSVVQGKLHVIEGNIHYIYDILADSWSNGTSVPVLSSGYVLKTDLDGKIYFFTKNTTQIYDLQSDTWSFGTPMRDYGYIPNNPVATTGVFAPKRIYFFGGIVHGFEYSDKTVIYDPQTDTWTTGANMPTARAAPTYAVLNDTIYVMSGMTSLHYRTSANEKYTPIGHIPEFSSWIILPFFVLITLVLLSSKNKLEKMNDVHNHGMPVPKHSISNSRKETENE